MFWLCEEAKKNQLKSAKRRDVSANTSTITCKLYLVNDWSLSISGRTDNTCTIDGTALTFSSPAIGSTGTHLLGTVSKTVNHASDGSKSLTISAVFQIRATLSGTYYGTISASANITLDSIPRASSVSAANMTMGTAGTITIKQGIFFVYPYVDLFLWEYQRDDYYQNDSHFGQVDAAAFTGQPDPECDQRYLHDHLHHL